MRIRITHALTTVIVLAAILMVASPPEARAAPVDLTETDLSFFSGSCPAGRPELSTTTEVAGDPVPGGTLNVDVTIENVGECDLGVGSTGGISTGVLVEVAGPGGARLTVMPTVVSLTGTADPEPEYGENLRWLPGELVVGESASISLTVDVPSGAVADPAGEASVVVSVATIAEGDDATGVWTAWGGATQTEVGGDLLAADRLTTVDIDRQWATSEWPPPGGLLDRPATRTYLVGGEDPRVWPAGQAWPDPAPTVYEHARMATLLLGPTGTEPGRPVPILSEVRAESPDARPGGVVEGTYRLTNLSPFTAELPEYLVASADGDPVPVTVEAVHGDLAAIPPGGHVDVDFSVDIPADAGQRLLDIEFMPGGLQGDEFATVSLRYRAGAGPTPAPPVGPTAVDDHTVIDEGEVATVDLLANDLEGDASFRMLGATLDRPQHGWIAASSIRQGQHAVTYQPNDGWTGTETLTYEICDTAGLCDQAVWTIVVEPAQAPPPTTTTITSTPPTTTSTPPTTPTTIDEPPAEDAPPIVPTRTPSTSELPRTGADPGRVAATGIAMVAAGTAAWILARRRVG